MISAPMHKTRAMKAVPIAEIFLDRIFHVGLFRLDCVYISSLSSRWLCKRSLDLEAVVFQLNLEMLDFGNVASLSTP